MFNHQKNELTALCEQALDYAQSGRAKGKIVVKIK